MINCDCLKVKLLHSKTSITILFMSKSCTLYLFNLILLLFFVSGVFGQEEKFIETPRGILLGEEWNPETRELDTLYEDQFVLDIGDNGSRTVHLWTEILNGSGRSLTWIIEYANGMRQEIWTQRIRYGRFRTYLEKTFYRNLWDAKSKQLVRITGPCTVLLLDKQDNNKVIVSKSFELK